MLKRLLFLGANAVQAYAIKSAKKLGYYVITCDYLPDNPGHKFGDKYINISTVDKDAVLLAARENRIDGIISFASDVSAPTAAFVAEQLGLPGHPPASIDILTHKDQFRAFLLSNGFASPYACGYTCSDDAIRDWERFRKPVVIKPTDSSGSKGVRRVTDLEQLPQAVEYALSFSRSRRFVMEEFIEMQGAQIIGDGFSVDGKLVFSLYGDHIFDSRSGGEFAVQGGMFPLAAGNSLKERVDAEVQRALTLLQMGSGAYNIEARLGKDGNVYLMEIGPRSGGNLIPELIFHATGVDLTKYTILAAAGEPCTALCQTQSKGFWSYYVIHSQKAGIYGGLEIDPAFLNEEHIKELLEQVKLGDKISAFENASAALGVAICRFDTRMEMENYMRDINQYIVVKVNDN
jgi:biotin carboxylase